MPVCSTGSCLKSTISRTPGTSIFLTYRTLSRSLASLPTLPSRRSFHLASTVQSTHTSSYRLATLKNKASVTWRCFATTSRRLAKAPEELISLKSLDEDKHHRLAESWIKGFTIDDIPKKSYEVSYARSSGPGGQHVNTTSSKAVIRMALGAGLGDWLPRYLLPHLAQSPHYLPNPPSLLVSSQISRTATTNAAAALSNLHKSILDAARVPIVGATSLEQKQRVKGLVSAEKARKRLMKDKTKATKASRRGDF